MTGIQILARSYRDRNIPILVTVEENVIVPFFSYNVTRVSRKEHKIFANIAIYKEWVIFSNLKDNTESLLLLLKIREFLLLHLHN